jgi:hypothetical protein
MNPQEILPTPESTASLELEKHHDGIEAAEPVSLEKKTRSSQAGSGVMTASAVDDAQSQLKGVSSGQDDDSSSQDLQVNDLPATAEDIDLIEKEWVKKAKDIVDSTYGDPYRQNQQINTMKVEYIKKRYNKTLKTRDEK